MISFIIGNLCLYIMYLDCSFFPFEIFLPISPNPIHFVFLTKKQRDIQTCVFILSHLRIWPQNAFIYQEISQCLLYAKAGLKINLQLAYPLFILWWAFELHEDVRHISGSEICAHFFPCREYSFSIWVRRGP